MAIALALSLGIFGRDDGGPSRDAASLPAVAAPPALASDHDDTQDDTLRPHADPVANYTLHATLDPIAHTVLGSGTIRWRNASRLPTREIWLHLYLNAFKNDRSDFLRERVGGRGSTRPETWGGIELQKLSLEDPGGPTNLLTGIELHRPGEEDDTDARVALPRDVAPGESITIDVGFEDTLPTIVERTGYKGHFHMVGQWFPKLARMEPDGTWAHFPFHHLAEFYADFGTYDVTLEVPETYTIGATGPTVETRVERGMRIERHVQRDVHDFAWTAWDRWLVEHESIDGVDVSVLYPPGFKSIADRDLAAVRFALPYDSARYGRYPYTVLTVVHPEDDASEAGGMEYPTLITSDGPWLTPKEIFVPEIVAIHELGHQWFYGMVATNEAAWPFLDEGINQFAEVDTMAKWRGEGSASDLFGLRLSDGAIQAVAGNRAAQDEPVAQSARSFSTGANYARLVYSRTAAVMETLGRVYGDHAVGAALGTYTRRFRFEHPGPEQFLSVFDEMLGRRVASTLRAALFEKGWVDYAIDDVQDRSVLVRRRGTLSFPVDVELVSTDGATRRELWDGEGESTRIPWRGPGTLRAAVVDPDARVMIDANLENNHGATPEGSASAPRSLERVTYWMQLALQALSP
jgi:hypothetical protein